VCATTVVNPGPRFERSACPVDVVPDEAIDCGVPTVPENRHKTDSRAIRLPVMIFHTRAAAPARDPVLFVPGGPGVSAVAGRKSARGNILLEDRDFIVLEPRGARHAQPALECRANLAASRVDLDGYRTEAQADDNEDLRKALGYEKWNLLEELRGGTHGAGFSPCGGEITRAFLHTPRSPLPLECALTLRGADFGLSARPQP
jgi:pimeloyl-ACP methyl ester carboxylesterase